MNVKVRPIAQLLHTPHLLSSFNVAIVFVTTRPNYYHFGSTSFYMLDMPDVSNYNVSQHIIGAFTDFLDRHIDESTTIYVCCDAGISRSPALAKFICEYFGQDSTWIDKDFPHYNKALYQKFKELTQ